jgi:transcriptional adapter 2-alpha
VRCADEPDVDTKPAKMEKTMPVNPSPLDLAGYMPKRGDFATEFENEAELIIAELLFAPDDTHEDRRTSLPVSLSLSLALC